MEDFRRGSIERRPTFFRKMAGIVLLTVFSTSSALCQTRLPGTHNPAEKTSTAEGSAQSANGAAPGQPTAPKPSVATRLAALPEPIPASLTQGIDRSEERRVGKESRS